MNRCGSSVCFKLTPSKWNFSLCLFYHFLLSFPTYVSAHFPISRLLSGLFLSNLYPKQVLLKMSCICRKVRGALRSGGPQ